MTEIPTHQRSCVEAGGHDFMEPVVVRQTFFALVFLHRVECAVTICRRCGGHASVGWQEGE